MPYLLFPAIPFGVRIPLSYSEDDAVAAERKRYVVRMLILEVALFAVQMILLTLTDNQLFSAFSILALAALSWVIYYLSHRRIAAIKKENNWYEHKHQVIAAHATPRPTIPSRLFWIMLLFPFAVILVTLIININAYANLPENIQYIFPGSLGTWTLSKTLFHAFLPVVFQLGISIVLAGFAWLRIFGGQPVEIEDPEQDQRYQKINVQIIQILLLALAFGFNCAFLVTGLSAWGIIKSVGFSTDLFTLAPIVVCLCIAPILLLSLRSNYEIPTTESKKVSLDDDRYWKLGVFYFNREDPSIMVNKRFGIGRTMNFGNPLTWVLMVALIVFIVIRSTR